MVCGCVIVVAKMGKGEIRKLGSNRHGHLALSTCRNVHGGTAMPEAMGGVCVLMRSKLIERVVGTTIMGRSLKSQVV